MWIVWPEAVKINKILHHDAKSNIKYKKATKTWTSLGGKKIYASGYIPLPAEARLRNTLATTHIAAYADIATCWHLRMFSLLCPMQCGDPVPGTLEEQDTITDQDNLWWLAASPLKPVFKQMATDVKSTTKQVTMPFSESSFFFLLQREQTTVGTVLSRTFGPYVHSFVFDNYYIITSCSSTTGQSARQLWKTPFVPCIYHNFLQNLYGSVKTDKKNDKKTHAMCLNKIS